jgi:hypothetical protein
MPPVTILCKRILAIAVENFGSRLLKRKGIVAITIKFVTLALCFGEN